jgi:hypothetical protein
VGQSDVEGLSEGVLLELSLGIIEVEGMIDIEG